MSGFVRGTLSIVFASAQQSNFRFRLRIEDTITRAINSPSKPVIGSLKFFRGGVIGALICDWPPKDSTCYLRSKIDKVECGSLIFAWDALCLDRPLLSVNQISSAETESHRSDFSFVFWETKTYRRARAASFAKSHAHSIIIGRTGNLSDASRGLFCRSKLRLHLSF